jgi:hypothetical protein
MHPTRISLFGISIADFTGIVAIIIAVVSLALTLKAGSCVYATGDLVRCETNGHAK